MEAWLQSLIESLLDLLALPRLGLVAVFFVSLVSATLLPLGSEPLVFAVAKANPAMFWPAVLIGTLGNTLGGAITWWMGWGAERVYEQRTLHPPTHARALRWLERFGPKACLLSWLPVLGDPLCALAGWLRMPFWPCVFYMAVGKGLRYVCMTAALLWVFPGGASA